MSLAVNASTVGMAVGSLAAALLSRRLGRRAGVAGSLAALVVPTVLLALLPPLAIFAALRVVQGVCMSVAFTLTLAYLGETADPRDAAAVFAAYITGNVGSNLAGRLLSAGVADHFGLAASFVAFAALNAAGVVLALATIRPPAGGAARAQPAGAAFGPALRNPALLADFGIGAAILFAFLGVFTFVNFVLARAPLSLGMMQIGFAYAVFLPPLLTTPLAGAVARRIGTRGALAGGLIVALAGLPLLLARHLAPVLAGMVLVAVGTFFAQAVATGFAGRAAAGDRAGATGLYLASYFAGGLIGSAVLGQVFDRFGWTACVAGVAAALSVALLLTLACASPAPPPHSRPERP